MDEPTSSLSQSESKNLFEVIRDLKSQGIAIIYISIDLGRSWNCLIAWRCCAMVRMPASWSAMKSYDAMVKLMVGRDLSVLQSHRHAPGEVVLE